MDRPVYDLESVGISSETVNDTGRWASLAWPLSIEIAALKSDVGN